MKADQENVNMYTFLAHMLKLASDVTYGMQKELFKFLLVTVFGAVLAELQSVLSTPKSPASIAKQIKAVGERMHPEDVHTHTHTHLLGPLGAVKWPQRLRCGFLGP